MKTNVTQPEDQSSWYKWQKKGTAAAPIGNCNTNFYMHITAYEFMHNIVSLVLL